jgi:putative ATP-dependent endonuclease of OLD family
MYLSRVTIKNFRSIEKLELSLSPGLNVLVGENNIGKSTVLDALRAALGAAASTGDPLWLTKDDLRCGPDGLPVTDPIRVDLVFADLSHEERAEFIELLNIDPNNPSAATASIHFEWTWVETAGRGRYHVRRWGADRPDAEAPIAEDVLQSLPITLLHALRDAVTALAPGRNSRLGRLLAAMADDSDRDEIVNIATDANSSLEATVLIDTAGKRIQKALTGTSGAHLAQQTGIQTSEPDFERIVNSLQLVLQLPGVVDANGSVRTRALRSNGLGYNNLLYIATVLAELQATASKQVALPLLLVEEPEAHLHPQLQTLLSNHLGSLRPEEGATSQVQTILTTHSPTIAAHVPTKTVRVLHRANEGGLRCVGFDACGLSDRETAQLRRMLDVTRASMLFARGVILVEGIAEALVLPVLARRLGISLDELAITVVPVCGVDFRTIAKLFGQEKLHIPVSIVTDGDPGVVTNTSNEKVPKQDANGEFSICERTEQLVEDFAGNPIVSVFRSKVTLEYDLAAAGPGNPKVMARAWEACFDGHPRNLNADVIDRCGTHDERVLTVWRSICLAESTVGKGAFAQSLAEELEPGSAFVAGTELPGFTIPDYLRKAIEHVVPKGTITQPTEDTAEVYIGVAEA